MTKPNIKIFVAHHKPGNIYKDNIIEPIHVGKENSKYNLGIIGDNTGDNISSKNGDYYAELTAQYWVWKNYDLTNIDYVGFCHYRRYMLFGKKGLNFKIKNYFWNCKIRYEKCMSIYFYITGQLLKWEYSEKNIKIVVNSILNKIIKSKNTDIFLPKRMLFVSNTEPLKQLGIKNNELWKILEEIILKKYPNYKNDLKELKKYKTASYCNMFLMKKNFYLDYCEWAFSILFEYEKCLHEKGLEKLFSNEPMCTVKQRILGFLSERMLNLFVLHQKNGGKTINYQAHTLQFID